MATDGTRSNPSWLALAGLAGLASFGFLVLALAAPGAGNGSLRRTTDWFRWQDAGVIIQAMSMLPATIALADRLPTARDWLRFGLAAQAVLALSSFLIFPHVTADMLYMLPQGAVGIWLIAVTAKRSGLPAATRWTGRIAGVGLLLIGIGAVLYAGLVAPRLLLRPLTNAEIDAQSWTTGNVVAHVFMAGGTVPGRLLYPVWCLLCWRAMVRRRPGP